LGKSKSTISIVLRTPKLTYQQHYIPGGTPDIPAAHIEKMMAEHCPLGRCATPEDVARVVGFLSSEDGGWVNGQVITISGKSNHQETSQTNRT
jgi:NAD(P)-dependent dehydrogenase (short-subunit alcohol dehydrogenase family)